MNFFLRKLSLATVCSLFLMTAPASAQELSSYDIDGLNAREAARMERVEVVARKRKTKKQKLARVCRKVSNIKGLLIKKTAGGHIPRSDARYSGFSIICAGKCAPFPAKVYHCDGSLAFRMGYYGKWSGNGKSRGYCGTASPQCPISSVRSRSKKLRCRGAGYLKVGKRSCMRFNLNSDRNGGV